ncbi:hypothetical protein TWF694_002452 [Orbilia ellipsospora]|uniref:Uncharacterized protein n=1 Tax=Orbilia ellipsospora TaxID=2528407 RepID=A0AAV9X203_9PEZI
MFLLQLPNPTLMEEHGGCETLIKIFQKISAGDVKRAPGKFLLVSETTQEMPEAERTVPSGNFELPGNEL